MYKTILAIILALFSAQFFGTAQPKEPELDSLQMTYYRWCLRHKSDPESLLKADTLFMLAGKEGNRRMQSVALCLKVDHYVRVKNLDSIKVWVERTREFTHTHQQYLHYYTAWSRLILYYAKYNQYTRAQYELDQFLKQAKVDDYKQAISQAYRLMGQINMTRGLLEESKNSYTKAIDFITQNNIDEPSIYYIYLQLAQLYTNSDEYDKADDALTKAEQTCRIPDMVWTVRTERVRLLIEENRIEEATRLFEEVKRHNSGQINPDVIQNVEVTLLEANHQYEQAIELITNRLNAATEGKSPEELLQSNSYYYIPLLYIKRANNYKILRRYKEALEEYERAWKFKEKQQNVENKLQLAEIATVMDVDRLNAEKSEALHQAQTERLRRTQTTIAGLTIILLFAAIFIVILFRLNRHLARAKQFAEESSRMKSYFIHNITHEINTPLNAIVGFSELAAGAPVDDIDRLSYLKIVQENSGYLQKLVDDMIYIADLESADRAPVTAAFDLNSCCRDAIARVAAETTEGKKIRFEPEQEPLQIRSSQYLLQKVLRELLSNAAHFDRSEQGIGLSYRIAPDRHSIRFCVEDHGPGIAASESERIFERFVKLNSFTQGLGLGLAVCQLIAQALGGEIQLDTTYREGARFWFEIPCEVVG